MYHWNLIKLLKWVIITKQKEEKTFLPSHSLSQHFNLARPNYCKTFAFTIIDKFMTFCCWKGKKKTVFNMYIFIHEEKFCLFVCYYILWLLELDKLLSSACIKARGTSSGLAGVRGHSICIKAKQRCTKVTFELVSLIYLYFILMSLAIFHRKDRKWKMRCKYINNKKCYLFYPSW